LRAFAAAGRAKKDKCVVSRHHRDLLILQVGPAGEAESWWLFFSDYRIDIHASPAAIEPHVAVK
jgi:hypothetical protein